MVTSGVVALGGALSHEANGGAWGFARVLRLEHPMLRTQSTDVLCDASTVAFSVFSEATTGLEAAHHGDALCIARLRAHAKGSGAKAALFRGPYAIMGGLGGLGLRAAKMIVESGASGIVLSSRGGRVTWLAIDAARSAMMRAAACDVGDSEEALALLAREALIGLLHAAGVLHDKMLRAMSTDDVHAVFVPKACAASHAEAIMRTPLEAAGLFSSVASTFGNVGQANYAAANAYLDALARCRRCHGSLISSLQIPAVSGAGMGAANFDKEQLDVMGAVSLDDFALCLSIALAPARAERERVLAPLVWSLLFASAALPALSEVSRDERSVVAVVTASAAGSKLAHSLTGLSTSQRRTHVEAFVLRVVRELTGAPAASLTAETPLMEAGVDSLAATELSSRLRSLTGVALSPTIVFEQPTPRAVAVHLLEQAEGHEVAQVQPCVAVAERGTVLAMDGAAGQWPG